MNILISHSFVNFPPQDCVEALPDFLRNKYCYYTKQVINFTDMLKQILPNAPFQKPVSYIKTSSNIAYEDDGETECKGTKIYCVWHYGIGSGNYRQSEFNEWYSGGGYNSLWFNIEFSFRNKDNQLKRNLFPCIDIDKWTDEKRVSIQTYYTDFINEFYTTRRSIADAAYNINLICQRIALEKTVATVLNSYGLKDIEINEKLIPKS